MPFEQVCYLFADAYPSLSDSLRVLHGLQSCPMELHCVTRKPFRSEAETHLGELQLHSQLHVVPTACVNLMSQMLYLQDYLDSRRTLFLSGTDLLERPLDLAAFLDATAAHQAVVLATTDAHDIGLGIRCDAYGAIEELTDGSETEFYYAEGLLLLASGQLALAPAMQSLRRGRPAVAGCELMSLVNDAVLLGIDVKACDRSGRLVHARSATIPFATRSAQIRKAA